MRIFMPVVLLTATVTGLAQTWEAGCAAGGSLSRNVGVSNPLGQASAGLASGAAFGAVLGQNIHRIVSGEIRYTFQPGEIQVASGAARTGFRSQFHAIHYDLLFHTRPEGSPVRPFLAAGGGGRIFKGTGKEAAYQPLQEYALLTKTWEWKPMASVGGGVKVAISRRIFLRVEFRDYISPFPKQVIAPADGSKISGWLHSVVPLVGISVFL
jgi:hypothetical protein